MNKYFCLQPYHIGEKLLACLFNNINEIIKEKFGIENFAEAIPEQSFTFNDQNIRTDDQHKIDIALRDKNRNFYPVELKLGPHNIITKENKVKVTNLFVRYFKNKCNVKKNTLNGNMCCLLSNQWEKDFHEIPEWFINKKGDVFPNWFLIVRDNSVKNLLAKSKSKYLSDGLKNCTVFSLEEIIEGNEANFMDCIYQCSVLPRMDDYLMKWGLSSLIK